MAHPLEQHYRLRWNNHQANLIEAFDQLLINEEFADVTLGGEDGPHVKCHRMVLAACSTYFKTLFMDLGHTHPVVVLKDVKCKEIKAILEYMYTGEVKVVQEELAALLKVAELLKVKGLVATDESTSSLLENRRHEETISTSTGSNAANSFEGVPGVGPGRGHSSPPHSTSSPCYGYGVKSPNARGHPPTDYRTPLWAARQSLALAGQNSAIAAAALHSSMSAKHASLFASHWDNGAEASTPHCNRKRKMSGGNATTRSFDTPILRTVLGQGHADSSQAIANMQADTHESHYRMSRSNGSANNDLEEKRASVDASNCHSSQNSCAGEASLTEEDEKKHKSFLDDSKAGIANYVPAQKPEWKRYKQYTRKDIEDAINAVKDGTSALQAARKFGVPSRTLYDKVKKLGITTSRPFKRGSNGGSACFPFGLGGNVNGRIYDNENSGGVPMENPSAVLETGFSEIRDDSNDDREAMMDVAQRSSSPRLPLHYLPPIPQQTLQLQLQQQQQQQLQEQQRQEQSQSPGQESENEVEDLSVSRRSDVRVIMPPSVGIKEEP